jgi:hypothetical protein
VSHDHARPDIAVQRAAITLNRALLAGDAERAALASLRAPCGVCLVLSAAALGLSLAAAVTGQPGITEELCARLAALLDVAEKELDTGLN